MGLGMSSSTTTYIIAPAENAKSQGMKGTMTEANRTTRTPNTGSARPESAPWRTRAARSSLLHQGKRHRRALGDVLDADADRQRNRHAEGRRVPC